MSRGAAPRGYDFCMYFFNSVHFHPSFLPRSTREVKELTFSMMLREFAGSAIMLFEPIYLYQNGFSIPAIFLFFAAIYALYLALLPLGGKFIRAHGYEHGIVYSTPFLVLYYLSLLAVSASPYAVIPAVICIALSKTLFWTGFHADFARYGSVKGAQGRELSAFAIASSLASIMGPLVGGAVLALFGFTPLFIGVAALLMISNLPLLLTPEVFLPRGLSYRDAWKRFFRPLNRPRLFTFAGYGEELVVQSLWPLFMFIVVPGFVALGAIGSIASLATVAATVAIGRLTDAQGRHRMLRIGTLFTSLTWLMRVGMVTPVGILFAHTLSRAAHTAVSIPLIALTYEYARSYSVTKTALFLEMSVALAKLVAAMICLALFLLLPSGFAAAFVLAAGFSLLYLFARRAF